MAIDTYEEQINSKEMNDKDIRRILSFAFPFIFTKEHQIVRENKDHEIKPAPGALTRQAAQNLPRLWTMRWQERI